MSNSNETGKYLTSRRKILFLTGAVALTPILEACGFQEPEVIGIHNGKVEINPYAQTQPVNVRVYPSLRADIIPWKTENRISPYLEPVNKIIINFPELVQGDDPDSDTLEKGYWIKFRWNVFNGTSATQKTVYLSWSSETANYLISQKREIIQKDKNGRYLNPITGKQISDYIIGEQILELK